MLFEYVATEAKDFKASGVTALITFLSERVTEERIFGSSHFPSVELELSFSPEHQSLVKFVAEECDAGMVLVVSDRGACAESGDFLDGPTCIDLTLLCLLFSLLRNISSPSSVIDPQRRAVVFVNSTPTGKGVCSKLQVVFFTAWKDSKGADSYLILPSDIEVRWSIGDVWKSPSLERTHFASALAMVLGGVKGKTSRSFLAIFKGATVGSSLKRVRFSSSLNSSGVILTLFCSFVKDEEQELRDHVDSEDATVLRTLDVPVVT